MDAPTNHPRFVVLDGIRGMAAVVVMLFHFTQKSGNPFFRYGWTAVDLFFILSGFVVALAYESKIEKGLTFAAFTRLRILRLYPLYLTGLGIGIVSFFLLGRERFDTGISVGAAFSLGLLLLPYFGPHRMPLAGDWRTGELFPLNGPSWSLFFEMVVNLVFGYFTAVRRISMKYFFACGVVAMLLVHAAAKSRQASVGLDGGWGYENIGVGLIRVVYGFPAGVLLYHLFSQKKLPAISINGVWVIGATALAMLGPECLGHPHFLRWLTSHYPVFLSLFFWPAMVWLGAHSSAGRMTAPVLGWLGGISYAVYAIHFPLFRIISLYPNIDPTASVFVGVAVTLILAHVLTYHAEPRMRKYMATRLAW